MMKNFITGAFLLFLGFGTLTARAQEVIPVLVIIDGEVATSIELQEAASAIEQIHFLSPKDAGRLYGVAGAGGAFLVKTRMKEEKEKTGPVILMEGKVVPEDTLQNVPFEKIDVIRGNQAFYLYGPSAEGGVWIVQPEGEPAGKPCEGRDTN